MLGKQLSYYEAEIALLNGLIDPIKVDGKKAASIMRQILGRSEKRAE